MRALSMFAAGLVMLQTGVAQTVSLSGSLIDELSSLIAARVDLMRHGAEGLLKTSNGATFIFDGLEPGVYDLHAYTSGFVSNTVEGIRLTAGQQRSLSALVLRVQGLCPAYLPPERRYPTLAESAELAGHVADEDGVM